jgi:hypothetical protein
MRRKPFCFSATLSALAIGILQSAAQPQIPFLYFTNAYATDTTFHFETSADLGTAWRIESATALSGPWLPYLLPAPGGRVFDVPLDLPVRFFRARNDDFQTVVYSQNAAYYRRYPLTSGFSLLANPFDNGRSNRLSEIIPAPPPGTRAYQFAPSSQQWTVVSQFVWDAWTPDLIWPPGQGLALVLPKPMNHTFAGAPASTPRPPVIRPGAQLLGLPFPTQTIGPLGPFVSGPEAGDLAFLYDAQMMDYQMYTCVDLPGIGLWDPEEPNPALGQGYWYLRPPGPGTTVAIHFNNYVPEAGIDAPLAHSGRLLEGTNWLAQLYYSLTGPPDTPIGTPVPFRSGMAAGYLDTSSGGVALFPHPGSNFVNVQIRYWQIDGAGSGMTDPIPVQVGTGSDAIPRLPANLVGLGGPSASQQPHLSRPEWNAGEFRFRFSATLGSNYVIESSTTLTNWSLFRALTNLSGPAFFSESNCLCPGPQFYRARVVAP